MRSVEDVGPEIDEGISLRVSGDMLAEGTWGRDNMIVEEFRGTWGRDNMMVELRGNVEWRTC